jgi:hypothetical protein
MDDAPNSYPGLFGVSSMIDAGVFGRIARGERRMPVEQREQRRAERPDVVGHGRRLAVDDLRRGVLVAEPFQGRRVRGVDAAGDPSRCRAGPRR